MRGEVADDRFEEYIVEFRQLPSTQWEFIASDTTPSVDGVLAIVNSNDYPDGEYELRVSVVDNLGLTGRAVTRILIDNEEPRAVVTSPARVSATSGGHVYTTNREVHLYFPPRAFDVDALVSIDTVAAGTVPDSLPDGTVWTLPAYQLDWEGRTLEKPSILELSLATQARQSPSPILYRYDATGGWREVGGTVDNDFSVISAPLTESGAYALFPANDVSAGVQPPLAVSLTPRVFSPRGGFSSTRLAIGFTLPSPGRVTIKIYDRSGRLIRDVESGSQMFAGRNLVYWDGRDRDGSIVRDGLYLVSIRGPGLQVSKPLSVVE